MKVYHSLRSKLLRDKNNFMVRRGKRVYILNKKKPKFKCRQG